MWRWHRVILAVATVLASTSLLDSCILCGPDNPDLCMTVVNQCEEAAGDLLAYTAYELDLRKSVVRTSEAAIGDLVTDAFYFTAKAFCSDATGKPCPVAAVENGGGIRSQTTCGERQLIPAGPLYQRDVKQILPFANGLVVTELSGHDLKLALEHSVDLLGQAGNNGLAGHFLQVSRLKFAVDCSQPAQTVDANKEQILNVGARIVPGSLMVRSNEDDAHPTWEAVSDSRTHTYPVAMSSFIGAGGDGFVAFVQRDNSEKAVCETDPCDGNYVNKILYSVSKDGQDLADSDAFEYFLRNKREVSYWPENRIEVPANCRTTAH